MKIIFISLVLIFLIGFVSAVPIIQTMTADSGWSSNAQTARYGATFRTNSSSLGNIYLIYNVTKPSISTATRAYIFTAGVSGVQIANATFVGNVAQFNSSPVQLNASTYYAVLLDADGASYTRPYKVSWSPVPLQYINYTGADPNNGSETGQIVNMYVDIANATTVTISSPTNNTESVTGINETFTVSVSGSNNISNVTMYINGALNETKSLTGIINSTSFYKVFSSAVNYTYYFNACTIDGNCTNSSTNRLIVLSYKINSVAYTSSVASGSLNNFSINLSLDSSITGTSIYLNYNNTNYTMSTSDTGVTKLYSVQIYAPQVSSIMNKTFYYILVLTTSNSTITTNTTNYNQTISPIILDNCSTYSTTLFNITMLDEEILSRINGTIEFFAQLYTLDRSSIVSSYNNSFNHSSITPTRICINSLNTSYSTDYTIRHYGDGNYVKKFRNIQNLTLNNITTPSNITLYNLNNITSYPFNIIVVGNILTVNGNENVLVSIQRKYTSQGQFILVESPVTGSEGIAIANLLQASEIYNFVVSYMGITLGTFNNYQVKCQNPSILQCTITLNIATSTADIEDFTNTGDVDLVPLLSNTTFYLTYSSTDGEAHTIITTLYQSDGEGNTTILNLSSYGTSGTLFGSIPEVYQNTSFYAQTTIDGVLYLESYFTQGESPNWQGVDLFMELLMFSSLTLLFIAHPVLIVIGSIIGIVAPIMLIWVSDGNFSSIIVSVIYYVVFGGLVIWLLSKRSNR